MKKKELLKRIETLEFKLSEFDSTETTLINQIEWLNNQRSNQQSEITALGANLEKSDIASLKNSLALQEKQIEKLTQALDNLSRNINPHKPGYSK